MDIKLKNIWESWFAFRKGKRQSSDMHVYRYNLEENLFSLFRDTQSGKYRHGSYRQFFVNERKKRKISVASTRDKVVHRFIYEYLVEIYDKTFIFDAWSCRKNKGLLGAIERTQYFLKKYRKHFVWKADIKKFFDNVDHEILFFLIQRKIKNQKILCLLREIISSFHTHTHTQVRPQECPSAILQARFLRIFILMNLTGL